VEQDQHAALGRSARHGQIEEAARSRRQLGDLHAGREIFVQRAVVDGGDPLARSQVEQLHDVRRVDPGGDVDHGERRGTAVEEAWRQGRRQRSGRR
jgi:hypothetical protein